MDVLSDVLDNVRLTSTVFGQARLAAPWGMRAEPSPYHAFHVVVRGRCWLETEGTKPIDLEAGDVVVLGAQRAHTLRDARRSTARPLRDLIADGVFAPDRTLPAGSLETQIVCGCFRFEGPTDSVLLAALPMLLHGRDLGAEAEAWLAQTIRLLGNEARAQRPGGAIVMQRLCDALFVYVLRAHLASLSEREPSWLRALIDPRVGAALRLIHESPGHPWTVNELAEKAGMSRSAFAAHFAATVGETPLQYVMRWRAQKAAALLRQDQLALGEIAARVGYASESAFNKAFKRMLGVAPGSYRESLASRG